MATPYSVNVVCTGNICRSPIAEVVLRRALSEAGLGDQVTVTSAGTGHWHIGHDMDHRARHVLTEAGHEVPRHAAELFEPPMFAAADLILALDTSHLHELSQMALDEQAAGKVRLLRSFDPDLSEHDNLDVPDPYYGDRRDFELTYAAVTAAVPGIVAHIRDQLPQ